MNTPVYWIEWSGTISQDVLLTGWAALSVTYALLAAAVAWMLRGPGSGMSDSTIRDSRSGIRKISDQRSAVQDEWLPPR
jgi:hypothetical protein